MIDPNYDPGEVWDSLQDDHRLKKAAATLKKAAAAYVVAVGDAIEAMEDLARRDRDNEFQQEVDENRYAFVEKLAKTALHVDLEELKAEYLKRESEEDEPQGDECGACGKCGSLSPWRCGCNDKVAQPRR